MRIKWSSILIRVRHLEQECMRQPSFVSGRSEVRDGEDEDS